MGKIIKTSIRRLHAWVELKISMTSTFDWIMSTESEFHRSLIARKIIIFSVVLLAFLCNLIQLRLLSHLRHNEKLIMEWNDCEKMSRWEKWNWNIKIVESIKFYDNHFFLVFVVASSRQNDHMSITSSEIFREMRNDSFVLTERTAEKARKSRRY